ncbi:MAG TPA: TAXI family TRAP transporter solute-binding subunit, partial [Trichocoleus sp.]
YECCSIKTLCSFPPWPTVLTFALLAFFRLPDATARQRHPVPQRWWSVAALTLLLGGCSPRAQTVLLSGGVEGGFYHRLGDQISRSAQETVDLTVQNQPSQGSRQNLERLLNREVDFALVQLDVASQELREGKVLAVATLAQEGVHIVVWRDAGLQTLDDLQGKRLAVGALGSGIRFTADRLLESTQLRYEADESGFDDAWKRLKSRQIDALIYVGSVGASERLRQELGTNPYDLVAVPEQVTNYLRLLNPGSYQMATVPQGVYSASPVVPSQPISTLATSTVLVTRPDVSRKTVGLVTWAILSDARTYALTYPELLEGNARDLLQRGLLYLHPAAAEVYENGDPRAALARYWRDNNDLQASVFLLGTTTVVGVLLRHWRKRQARKTLIATGDRINELRQLLPDHPQQALSGIEALSQEHRLRFIDGAISSEIYDQLQQKTRTFTDQCRAQLDQQRTQFVLDTLLLLDEWQVTLLNNPGAALQKLSQIKTQYREMLLAGQVDIEAYIELVQLTLMSVMTLVPTPHSNGELPSMQGIIDAL